MHGPSQVQGATGWVPAWPPRSVGSFAKSAARLAADNRVERNCEFRVVDTGGRRRQDRLASNSCSFNAASNCASVKSRGSMW